MAKLCRGGQHHAPDLSGLARAAIVVQYLHQRGFGLQVIVIEFRALQGDRPVLLVAVDILDLDAPDLSAGRAQIRRHDLGDGHGMAEFFQTYPLLLRLAQQRAEIGRIGEDVVGIFALQPFDLLAHRPTDVDQRGRAGRCDAARCLTPAVGVHALRRVGLWVFADTNRSQLGTDVTTMPQVIARRECQPHHLACRSIRTS